MEPHCYLNTGLEYLRTIPRSPPSKRISLNGLEVYELKGVEAFPYPEQGSDETKKNF